MSRYSIFSLLRNGLSYHQNWQRQWKSPRRAPPMTWVIVGGGGHGLATAYYRWASTASPTWPCWKRLDRRRQHGPQHHHRPFHYLWDESAALYEKAMKLWEGLSQDLNYNVMFSQRGVMNLAHTLQDVRDTQRRVNANRLNGIDAEFLTPAQVQEIEPAINLTAATRCWARRSSGARAWPGMTRWLGYSARRRPRGRPYHSELPGDRHPPRGWGGGRRRDHAGLHQGRQGRRGGRRQYHHACRHGWRAPAAGKPSAAGAGIRAACRCSIP